MLSVYLYVVYHCKFTLTASSALTIYLRQPTCNLHTAKTVAFATGWLTLQMRKKTIKWTIWNATECECNFHRSVDLCCSERRHKRDWILCDAKIDFTRTHRSLKLYVNSYHIIRKMCKWTCSIRFYSLFIAYNIIFWHKIKFKCMLHYSWEKTYKNILIR